METPNEQMKEFITLMEKHFENVRGEPELVQAEEPEVLEEAVISAKQQMITECRDLMFKLRSYSEAEDTDYALGVESGMQRAADMVENMLKRLTGN